MAIKRRGKILLAVFGLGALGIGSVFAVPPVIIKPLAEQFLHHHGFPDARISNLSVMPAGIMIDHISLDGDDFSTLDGISIEGDWMTMALDGQIDALTIKDIALAAEIDESGHYSVSGWNAELPSGSTAAALLPIKNILLQGVTIDVETPQGNIRAEGKLSFSTPSADKQVFQYTSWGRQKQLSYTLSGKGELSSDGTWSTSTTIEDGRVSIAGADISRTSGYIDIAKNSSDAPLITKGHIVAGRINYDKILLQNIDTQFDSSKADALTFTASPSGHSDIKFTAAWKTQPQSQLSLNLTGKKIAEITELLPDDKKEVLSPLADKWLTDISSFSVTAAAPLNEWMAENKNINISATLSAGEKSITATPILTYAKEKGITAIKLNRTEFDAAALDAVFSVQKNSDVKLTSGTIDVGGTIDFSDTPSAKQSALTVGLNKLSVNSAGVDIDTIGGTFTLDNLSPISLATPSQLNYALPDNLGKGSLTLSGDVKRGLKIDKFRTDIAGGTIDADSFTLLFDDKKSVTTTLGFHAIQIEKLVALADIDGLKGEGTLSGKIPVTIKGDSITLGDALLENESTGSFSYTPADYPSSLQGDDARMETVRQSLKDFRFSKLSLSLHGPLSGKMVTSLKAEGTNPVFGDRPIHLNLNLEGDLAPLVKNMMGGLTLPTGEIQDKIRSKNNPPKQ